MQIDTAAAIDLSKEKKPVSYTHLHFTSVLLVPVLIPLQIKNRS